MAPTPSKTVPDSTAVRVALWRALHLQIDGKPPVFTDEIGLRLASPQEGWQQRPDMHPQGTQGYRAAIVGRARFTEDLVLEKYKEGVHQLVILGAGLDTFAQRKPPGTDDLRVFEIDQPETQAWKKQRLHELGLKDFPQFVPVDFEQGETWPEQLIASGFDSTKPAVIVSTGVAMYLTREANRATLQQIVRTFAAGSTLVLSFLLPTELVEPSEQEAFRFVQERAKESGTPFLSLFPPEEVLSLAREVGFHKVEHVSRQNLIDLYFAQRGDRLVPSSGEEIMVATTK